MKRFIKIFINTKAISKEETEEAYSQQLKYLKRVWDDDSFGLERIVRLFLCTAQFIFPVLFIRDIFGRGGVVSRKLAVEFYTFLKFLFPLFVLVSGLYRYHLVIFVIIYLLCETILHITNLVFLSDIYSVSISYRRSILILCLHYIEVVLAFATIYIGFDLVSEKLTWVSAAYFSLVANATVGFGDIIPKGSVGQLVLMAQLLVGILFVVLFINYFSQKVNEK
jgi:hypothetical protein